MNVKTAPADIPIPEHMPILNAKGSELVSVKDKSFINKADLFFKIITPYEKFCVLVYIIF